MEHSITVWIVFNLLIVFFLILDLKLFHREAHDVQLKEALIWSVIWIVLSFMFCVIIYFWMNQEKAIEFITAYLIEKSLSMDNLFVFYMILSYFEVPSRFQHKVLFWGIFGALIMRALFIIMGVTLINNFHWTIYVFGILLIYTGLRMSAETDATTHPENNVLIKIARLLIPVTNSYDKGQFFVKQDKVLHATPLFIVLLVIESTDVMFAVDSVPAVLSVSTDAFIVYSSNAFAILGLRALYFALESSIREFYFLKYGLAIILVLVGIKMVFSNMYPIPAIAILISIFLIISVSISISILSKNKQNKEEK